MKIKLTPRQQVKVDRLLPTLPKDKAISLVLTREKRMASNKTNTKFHSHYRSPAGWYL